jgi:hypothetical protein
MTMQTSVRREDLPVCFGREWDPGVADCAGGADAGYVHPLTKSNVRDKCNYFNSCGARTQASRQASNVIPASQLVRPPVVTPPPPTTFADYLRQKNSEYAESMRQTAFAQQQPQPGVVPRSVPVVGQPQQQAQTMTVAHNPGQLWHLNYSMPGYLSVPEERLPGESLGSVLLREVIRSILKAAGHALAHFFDARRIKEKS